MGYIGGIYGGYVRTMENEMEAIIVYCHARVWGLRGFRLQLCGGLGFRASNPKPERLKLLICYKTHPHIHPQHSPFLSQILIRGLQTLNPKNLQF